MPACPICASSRRSKMAASATVNNGSKAMTADDSSSSNRLKKSSTLPQGDWLTDCCWNAFLWLELLVQPKFLNNGYKPTSMRNMLWYRGKCRRQPKQGEANNSMRWIMVIRGQQREQAVGLVGSWCRHSWDVGVTIGAQDEAAARKLWESLPGVYRQCAIAYTDFWAAILQQFYPARGIVQWAA